MPDHLGLSSQSLEAALRPAGYLRLVAIKN
jgi:hypothetical protein